MGPKVMVTKEDSLDEDVHFNDNDQLEETQDESDTGDQGDLELGQYQAQATDGHEADPEEDDVGNGSGVMH
ncbi:hypothetical protein NDA18_002884 [Ustilago nuda]|nr:hypothetical protein NDA18_002884 [Ustilago nuda]